MRRAPVLALLAFLASSLLIYAFGDSGLTTYRRLSGYRDRLAANVASLEANNRALQSELASLQKDPDRTVVLARELGLYRPEDRVLRIEGMPQRVEPYSVGTLLRYRATSRLRGPWLKTAGVAIIALPVGIAALLRRRSRRRSRGRRHR
jgi:cell division protein FtsB